MSEQELEEIALKTGWELCWTSLPFWGGRRRNWCLVCREQGREWLTPEPCEHIRGARGSAKASPKEVAATIAHFLSGK